MEGDREKQTNIKYKICPIKCDEETKPGKG